MTDTENKTIELTDEELDTVVGGTGIFFLKEENQAHPKTEAKTPVKSKSHGGAIYNYENLPNMIDVTE